MAQALVSFVPLQTTYLKAVMPRRNFMVDAEGVVWHVFESGSEPEDAEEDEGVEDMLRRMRGVVDDEEEDLWDLVLAAVELQRWNTAEARLQRLREWFDRWEAWCPFWSGCFRLP